MMGFIIAAAFWENPAVVGLIVALPAFALGWLGYRRSRVIDAAAERADTAKGQITSVQQVIDGLHNLVEAVQGDNAALRETVRLCAQETGAIRAQLDALTDENASLKDRIDGLEKANGAAHVNGGAL